MYIIYIFFRDGETKEGILINAPGLTRLHRKSKY